MSASTTRAMRTTRVAMPPTIRRATYGGALPRVTGHRTLRRDWGGPLMTWVIRTLVIVAALVLGAVVIEQQRSAMLRRRFGPEYQRALDEHGDRRGAEAVLRERIKRRKSVELLDLTPASAERYLAKWRAVQAGFVDDPKGSVTSARTLVEQLIVERGYRDGDGAEVGDANRMELVAIDHPHLVAEYRKAGRVSPDASLDDLRATFVHYRDLFEALLADGTNRTADNGEDDGDRARRPGIRFGASR